MKALFFCLLGALVLLQYRLWASDEGMREVWALERSVAAQLAENAVLAERNTQQQAEVADLKKGFTALEDRHDRRERDVLPVRRPAASAAGRAAGEPGVCRTLMPRCPNASGS